MSVTGGIAMVATSNFANRRYEQMNARTPETISWMSTRMPSNCQPADFDAVVEKDAYHDQKERKEIGEPEQATKEETAETLRDGDGDDVPQRANDLGHPFCRCLAALDMIFIGKTVKHVAADIRRARYVFQHAPWLQFSITRLSSQTK
jgi:hypothetical protein